jgi:imidazolonepropionase-like amidohydrolase
MSMLQKSTLAIAALCLSHWALAQSTNSFAIKNARVFDGEKVLFETDVIVRDGRVIKVGKKLTTGDLPVLDGTGKTLLPGLIDAHTHSWMDAQKEALRFGVTTELDMMGDWHRFPIIKKQRESLAQTDQADLFSAGAAVTAPGGHGTQYGTNPPTLAADGDTKAFVHARIADGSDYIKLIVEDLSAYSTTKRLPTLSLAQIKTSIAAAHAGQRMAVVHVSKHDAAAEVIAAGADGLVHIFADQPMDAALLALSKKQGIFVVPTLSVIAAVAAIGEGSKLAADSELSKRLSASQKQSLQTQFPRATDPAQFNRALASVRALHKAGVDLLAGTDAGNPGTAHGASLHGELALLVSAGLTPIEALAAATSVPANRFKLSGRGHIRAGDRADLVLVKGDPTKQIEATRAIESVWKNGYGVALAAPIVQAAAAIDSKLTNSTLISDFEGTELSVQLGFGWQPTTDQMAGGASLVALARSTPGSQKSAAAMRVSGEIKAGFAFPWSGAMWFPAKQPMQAVDYSSRSEIVFDTRGDGGSYNVMVFSGESVQGIPISVSFIASKKWQTVRVKLSEFAGADFKQLRGIAFTAGGAPHGFSFEMDHIEVR